MIIIEYNAAIANIYLFTGENDYLLREERRRWIGEFVKKYGDENCARLDGTKLTIRELLDEISVLPFLSEKRLVVVDGVPRSTKEEMQSIEASIHPQVLLLFADSSPDKRTAGVKELLKIAEVKEFAPTKGASLNGWMAAYAAEHGYVLPKIGADVLLGFVGEDQGMLAQEIQKLAAASHGKTLTRNDIEQLVIPTDEGVVWKITDLLSGGSKNDAFLYARRLLSRGGDAYGLWAILLSMLKNIVAVRAAADAGYRDLKDIAGAANVHPFAARSLVAYARRLKPEQLCAFLAWVVQSDRALKSGTLRSTDEAPQELLALIDRFILTCP